MCDVRGKEGLVTSNMHFNPNHMILLLLAKCNMGCTSVKFFYSRNEGLARRIGALLN
jgi:hypothetical protein